VSGDWQHFHIGNFLSILNFPASIKIFASFRDGEAVSCPVGGFSGRAAGAMRNRVTDYYYCRLQE
jgi:hypothetical protein